MSNAQIAYQYFISQGYAPHQAAGIVGNLMQESGQGLDVNALRENDAGPGLHSRGIGQWNRDRLANLQRFAQARGAPANDLQTQLAFVNWELNNTEIGAGKALRAAGNIDAATAAMIGYERPQGWTPQNPRGGHGFTNRLSYAQGLVGGPQTAAAPAPAPMGTSMGSYTGGMTDVALRQPANVQPIPAGDLPPAGGAGGKGGPGNSPYERQMRNGMMKEGRPQREIDAGMAQAAKVKSLPGPGMGGGKGGGGGKASLSGGGMSAAPQGASVQPLSAPPPADMGADPELPPPLAQAPKAPPTQGPLPAPEYTPPTPMQGPPKGPGGVPYEPKTSPTWDAGRNRFMPPVRPR